MAEPNKGSTFDEGQDWAKKVLGFFDGFRRTLETTRQTLNILMEKFYLNSCDWFKNANLKYEFKLMDFVLGGLSFGLLVGAGAILLAGSGLLAYQTVLWLQDGVWTAYPIMMVFDFVFQGSIFQVWLDSPESWLGLHQLVLWCLENIPTSLVLIVQGVLGVLVMSAVIASGVSFRFYQSNRGK